MYLLVESYLGFKPDKPMTAEELAMNWAQLRGQMSGLGGIKKIKPLKSIEDIPDEVPWLH